MKNVNKIFLTLLSIVFFSYFSNLYGVEFRGTGLEVYKGNSSKTKIKYLIAA